MNDHDREVLPRLNWYGNCPCTPNCEICGGFGVVRRDREIQDPLFGKLEVCPNKKKERISFENTGLDSSEKSLSWLQIAGINGVPEAIEKIEPIMDRGYGWVFIWGSPGLGKTTILKTIVGDYFQRNIEARYSLMGGVYNDIRSGYSQENPYMSVNTRLDKWKNIPCLCIDEIDRVKRSEFINEKEYEIFNYRYEQAIQRKTLTFFASNCSPESLEPYIKDRISDGRFETIHLQGKSARPSMEYFK